MPTYTIEKAVLPIAAVSASTSDFAHHFLVIRDENGQVLSEFHGHAYRSDGSSFDSISGKISLQSGSDSVNFVSLGFGDKIGAFEYTLDPNNPDADLSGSVYNFYRNQNGGEAPPAVLLGTVSSSDYSSLLSRLRLTRAYINAEELSYAPLPGLYNLLSSSSHANSNSTFSTFIAAVGISDQAVPLPDGVDRIRDTENGAEHLGPELR